MVKTIHHPVDERWLLSPPQEGERLDWEQVFTNANPVEIEIGCGKGRFVLAESSDRPHINFVGIERARKYLRITMDRLNRGGQANVRLLCVDAVYVLEQLILPSSVSVIHVYFPDPWPKARHHKRRLFRPPVARLMRSALIAGGEIRVASDHEEYFDHIVEVLNESGVWEHIEVWNSSAGTLDRAAATHFEIKFGRENRPIHRARYQLPPTI